MGVLVSCDKNDDVLMPEQEKAVVQENKSSLKSTKINALFFPEDAVWYALKYTNNSESAYDASPFNKFYDYSLPNDCANFVSQCIFYGGIHNDDISDDFVNGWSYDFAEEEPDYNSTYAWKNVTGLYLYLKREYYVKEYYIVTEAEYNAYKNEAKLGDLVFDTEAGHHHAMIITNIVKSGSTVQDVQYSGHTINRVNKTLHYVWNELPGSAGFSVIRIL